MVQRMLVYTTCKTHLYHDAFKTKISIKYINFSLQLSFVRVKWKKLWTFKWYSTLI